MDLFENPFCLLGLSARSTREEIMEAADVASLSWDPDRAADAAAALTSPRKRLSAEIFFLPGQDKAGAAWILGSYQNQIRRVEPCRWVSALAAVNITAAALSRLVDDGLGMTAYGVRLLSNAFESADAKGVMAFINSDRQLAGIPAVPSISDVEEEMDKLRLYCREVVKGALDRLPSRELTAAADQVVLTETDRGRRPPPVLVRDLMEIYDLETKAFFDREEANVKWLCWALKATAADKGQARKARGMASDLEKVLWNWESVAAPLLTFHESTGGMHRPTVAVALAVREVAVDICKPEESFGLGEILMLMLSRIFAGATEVSEIAEEGRRWIVGRR
ncbi:MAG: hypothetical protein LBQ12_10325 [Deltaproteobacteria bacterium]|jgi:hypothetical protein|nr:hypothetical protein [Deltaproteobacteria bacterium]